jgi:hypothetical protein
LLMAADLSLRLVSAICTPMAAAQMPHMIEDHRAGQWPQLRRRLLRLHGFVLLSGGALAVATLAAHALDLWIFRSQAVLVCALVGLGANLLLQLAVCTQKPLELDDRTLVVASSMLAACGAALTWAGIVGLGAAPPIAGLELLVGALCAYAWVFVAARRSSIWTQP